MTSSPPASHAAPDDATAWRHATRQRLIATRESLSETTRQTLQEALARHLQALLASHAPLSTLGFCWPFRAEPDLRHCVGSWLAADERRRAAMPVVIARDAPLRFRSWSPQSVMAPDRYGIPTPQDGDWLQPDIVLIPLNGFDARGHRLGYGGGYFDRTLAALMPPPLAIGVGFELGRLAHIAHEPHDKPMDWIVTEAGAFRAEPEPL